MLLEVTRMVADALDHETYGVNAQLSALPRDATDPEPPEVVKVIDPTRQDEAANEERIENVTDWPVILVAINQPVQLQGEVGTIVRDAQSVPVEIVYITNDADTAKYITDTMYTLRAILKTLGVWLDNAQAADRQRNSIVVDAANLITMGRVEERLSVGVVTGMVVLDLQVEDIAP